MAQIFNLNTQIFHQLRREYRAAKKVAKRQVNRGVNRLIAPFRIDLPSMPLGGGDAGIPPTPNHPELAATLALIRRHDDIRVHPNIGRYPIY